MFSSNFHWRQCCNKPIVELKINISRSTVFVKKCINLRRYYLYQCLDVSYFLFEILFRHYESVYGVWNLQPPLTFLAKNFPIYIYFFWAPYPKDKTATYYLLAYAVLLSVRRIRSSKVFHVTWTSHYSYYWVPYIT